MKWTIRHALQSPVPGSIPGAVSKEVPGRRVESRDEASHVRLDRGVVPVLRQPDDVHAALVRKAELAGQSLQQYLSAQLALLATTPSIDEVIDRIEGRAKGRLTRASAVAALRDERARR